MVRCRAMRKVTRWVVASGKKLRLSGRVRCCLQMGAHINNLELRHGGQFNKERVEWKTTDKEREGYQQVREEMRKAQK